MATETQVSETDAGRRPRGSLSADKILTGAFEYAARHSVEGISMPKLAKHLGIGVTSIYWYFKSKDDLLDAMTVDAMDRFYASLPSFVDRPWEERLFRHFVAFRSIFQVDDVLCDLILLRSRFHSERPLMAWRPRQEALFASMAEAGFTLQQAADAYFSLSVYTRGAVIVERLLRNDGHPMPVPHTRSSARHIDREQYPHVFAASLTHSFTGVNDDEFERGLRVFIEGIRRVPDAASATP